MKATCEVRSGTYLPARSTFNVPVRRGLTRARYDFRMTTMRPKSVNTERLGIHAVGVTSAQLGWAFREQEVEDYGIDAQIEVFDESGIATGKLLALQIKSGRATYFANAKEEGWTHYIEQKHANYWLKHSLPVVVVLYDEIANIAYWQQVNENTLESTKKNSKILVPRLQKFGLQSASALAEIAEGDPYSLRVRGLRLALPWMALLRSGRRILLEADEWINKTSGRGDIVIVSVDEESQDRQQLGHWAIVAPGKLYEDVLPELVPWADVVEHKESRELGDSGAWENEHLFYDNEGDAIITEAFNDWKDRRTSEGLRPHSSSAGEVDHWRLELKLNSLGNAFFLVDEFASSKKHFISPRP